jgi:hypothetical protein
MLPKLTLAAVAALGLLGVTAVPAAAQPPAFGPGVHHDGHYHVQYRLPYWKEKDFHSHFEAHRFADRKRGQGFEARVIHHGGHFHVRYRMLHWHEYRTVHSHAQAHRLEDMLRAKGFQARVVHH